MNHSLFKTVAGWLEELISAAPAKIRPTLLELLVGAIIAKSGHITNALLAINHEKHWTTYYKAIERATFQSRRFVKKLLALLVSLFGASEDIILAIDDTIVLRSSEKAPGAGIHHNHAKKKNTPSFVLGQLFVAIFFIASDALGHHHALPLAMHLAPKKGNASKLRIARFLAWVAWLWLKASKKNIILLCDSWYAKGPLFEPLAQIGIQCIGQVRRDTALFLQPKTTQQGRGRPRKYGQKIDRNDFQNMAPELEFTASAYGREGVFHYHEFKAMVRFLGGRLCKAVWCRFEAKNKSSGWRLIVSTNPELTGEQVIRLYAARWCVEPAFNAIKNSVGLKQAWQQNKEAHSRWRCILCAAYCVSVLANIFFDNQLKEIMPIPWRRKQPMSAPWAACALRLFFSCFRISTHWNRKLQKITMPDSGT